MEIGMVPHTITSSDPLEKIKKKLLHVPVSLISADFKVLVPDRELSYHEKQQISTELKAKGSPQQFKLLIP